MEIKSTNLKLKQSEIGTELKTSSSTLQRYRREMNVLSPYRIPPSSNSRTRKQNTTNHTENDLKLTSGNRKMTSNGLKMTSNEPVKNKKKLKGCDPNDNPTQGSILIEQVFLKKITLTNLFTTTKWLKFWKL